MSVLPYIWLTAGILRDEHGLAMPDRGWLQLRTASSCALGRTPGIVLDSRFDEPIESAIFVFVLGKPRVVAEAWLLMSVSLRQTRHLPLDMGALGRFVYRKVLYERLSGRQALGRGRAWHTLSGRAAWARAALPLA